MLILVGNFPGTIAGTTGVCSRPLLEKIGKRPLRDLTAGEVEAGLRSLSANLSSRSLQIAHNSLRRAIRYAEANGKVGRNVARLIDTPKGRAGRRRRAFTLAQAAALIVAARSRPALELHGGLKDPRRPGSLMHVYIVVSLMAGVRPEEARAIGWEEDVDLDGNPPSVAVLRADRAGGDTKTPRSRRALKLAQMAVGALREWQVDQAAEREAAGSRWQDTGEVFTTATGTPLGARHIRKMFQDVCERAGLGRDWAPRDLRHTFVWLLSDDGMAIEKIARLAGHASSHVTETVYRQELRPEAQVTVAPIQRPVPGGPGCSGARAAGNRVHSLAAHERQGNGRHSTAVSCRGQTSHSTPTQARACPRTRCRHQRRTRAMLGSRSCRHALMPM
jgi:integrase